MPTKEIQPLPDWAVIGAQVVLWNGNRQLEHLPTTIVRFTNTQIVLADGTRVRRSDLYSIGMGWHNDYLNPVTIPGFPEALARKKADDAAEARRKRMNQLIDNTSYEITRQRRKLAGDQTWDELRDLLTELGPYIGLTVTVDADICAYRSHDYKPCLLPAGHDGWHLGLGWCASGPM